LNKRCARQTINQQQNKIKNNRDFVIWIILNKDKKGKNNNRLNSVVVRKILQ